MELLAGLPCFIALVLLVVWIILQATTGIKKVGKIMRAIDKWSDSQLK